MFINRITSRYLSTVGFKLFGAGFAVMAFIALLLWVCNSRFLHMPPYLPIVVSLIPEAIFILYLLKSWLHDKNKILTRLARCKYNRFCSIYLYYDHSPTKSGNIDINAIIGKVRPCDILLRRYNYYLDGLVFSQNSFFSHAAIFYGNYNGKESQVIHSTGEHGVHLCDLEDFCKCDDLAILRFTTDGTEEDVEAYRNIIGSKAVPLKQSELIDRELEIFQGLMEDISNALENSCSSQENYKKIILARAESLIGSKYDSQFDFKNFDTFSCTEFVWYCFKCLFPLHRIKVKELAFFGCLKMPVILPDVFIKNDYFSFVYSSIPSAQNKSNLRKHIVTSHVSLIYFFLNILFWEAAILAGFYHIRPLIVQTWPVFTRHIF